MEIGLHALLMGEFKIIDSTQYQQKLQCENIWIFLIYFLTIKHKNVLYFSKQLECVYCS